MDPLTLYLERISRTPLLSQAEEHLLGVAIDAGRAAERRRDEGCGQDDDTVILQMAEGARRDLYLANLRLVVSIARRYPVCHPLVLDDLIQAGNEGLRRAVELFDVHRGFRFTTYASNWVRQSIGRTISSQTACAHIPTDRVDELRAALRDVNGDVAALSPRLAWIERAYHGASLDVSSDGGTLGELQRSTVDVEDQVIRNDARQNVRRLVAQLPNEHRSAVVLRFGLDGGPERSYAEIAGQLGRQPHRVAPLMRESMSLLRERLASSSS